MQIHASHFRCPQCHNPHLQQRPAALHCATCNNIYPIKEGKTFFIQPQSSGIHDPLDKVKFLFKRFSWFYRFVHILLSPVYVSRDEKKFVHAYASPTRVCLNIGSGNTRLSPHVTNIDFVPYPHVDIVADIFHIPLQDNCVDAVINIAVLEHVKNPHAVVEEMYRILKPGGKIMVFVPFIQGFHASPHDYYRYTREGMRELFGKFKEEKMLNAGGPTSGMLWILQEWVAITFSFGIRPLHTLLYLLVMVFTWPIKFLDILLRHVPTAHHISSGFYFIGVKE